MIEIIVNSRSKKSLIELKKIERVLNGKKLPYRVLKTSKNTNANDLMNEIHGGELIVIGGDGTINEVINNYHGELILYKVLYYHYQLVGGKLYLGIITAKLFT